MSRKMLLILPLAVAGMATSASAYDPIVMNNGWQQVSFDKDQGCEGEVRGNGKIYYVFAVGLGDGASAHYHLTNEDMVPIDWDITADDNGEWARYYVPFNYTPRDGGLPKASGTVNVSISSESCSLNMAFDWQDGYPVIEADGTMHIQNDDDFGQSVGLNP